MSVRRFSELCKNSRISSHQILILELTGWKPRFIAVNKAIVLVPPLYVTGGHGHSLSQVRFPTCQFYQSTIDVTRPCNFHKVLKTSVPPLYVTGGHGHSLSQVRFPTCQFYQSTIDVTRPCNFHKVLKTSVYPLWARNY